MCILYYCRSGRISRLDDSNFPSNFHHSYYAEYKQIEVTFSKRHFARFTYALIYERIIAFCSFRFLHPTRPTFFSLINVRDYANR